jgi:SAM-dependent methyltransferase
VSRWISSASPDWLTKYGEDIDSLEIRAYVKQWINGFAAQAPGRWKYFQHLIDFPPTYGEIMTSRHRAYSYLRAIAALFLGYHHLHVLDDVRMKRKRMFASSEDKKVAPEKEKALAAKAGIETMTFENARGARTVATSETGQLAQEEAAPECPACSAISRQAAIEHYGRYRLFGCEACGLQFWEPRQMPDARWYEQMYGGRDEKLLPLEPGHKYFLADSLAPGSGKLLDIGCGTGNLLAAARDAGYEVTGIELDRNAARFAKERLGLQNICPLTVSEFAEQHAEERFDVVTFFEVLEHQAAPVEFLQKVRACVRPDGMIALSVPNRERWLTGPDVLDYPPNHFLRWNADALKKVLKAQGFEVLSIREQPAGLRHTAQMINMALQTGISRPATAEESKSFRDLMQMAPDQAEAVLRAKPTRRQRTIEILGRVKSAACFPLAVAAYPYVRIRGLKGTYLYCLARKRDSRCGKP